VKSDKKADPSSFAFWEKVLHDHNLGMDRGRRKYIVYGHDGFSDFSTSYVFNPLVEYEDKPRPTDFLPDLGPITIYVTEAWIGAHGITHNCQIGLWSVLMPTAVISKPKAGYVYFIANPETNKIKIGFSDDPERRLAEGKTWCPKAKLLKVVRVPDMSAAEFYYHARFKQDHFDGEWFLPSSSLLEFVSSVESVSYEVKRVDDSNASRIPV